MLAPLAIERQYRDLLYTLSYPSSPRSRLRVVAVFLSGIQSDAALVESYVIELAEKLTRIIPALDLEGCDPKELHTILELLGRVEAELPAASDIEGLTESMTRLRREVARLFLYVGELQSAMRVLSSDETLVVSPKVREMFGDARVPLQKKFSSAIEQLTLEGNPCAAQLQDVLEKPAENSLQMELSVLVPVVERPLTSDGNTVHEGALRRLSLRLLGRAPGARDEIHTDVSVFGAEVNTGTLFQAPVAAARSSIAADHPSLAKFHVEARVAFHGAHALHEGSSANLALAALVYCSVLRQAGERNQFLLPENLAICGVIMDSGDVLPVDETGIPLKVKAAFFSRVEFLVVPKQQLQLAESFVSALAEHYPHRNLTVIGLSHLRELFFDRRLAESVRTPLPIHVVRRFWKYRRLVAAAILLGLLTVIWIFAVPPLDQNPEGYRFEGEELLVMNKSHHVIERVHVGKRTVDAATRKDLFRSEGHLVAFADMNGDGKNEIIWAAFVGNETQRMSVSCKKVGEERILWSYLAEKRLDFARNTDVHSSQFIVREIHASDLDGDGDFEVVVNANHQIAFAGFISVLEGETGIESAHYIHIGHLVNSRVHDIDGDGMKEILAVGVNNAYKSACLVVLDPKRLGGHSPLTREYELRGYVPAKEIAYVLIPRTVVGNFYRLRDKYNRVGSLRINEADSSIAVTVLDFLLVSDNDEEPATASFHIVFGFDLAAKSITTGDDFDTVYDAFQQDGKIPREPQSEYMEKYRKEKLLYWDGETWRSEPVLNREEAVRKHADGQSGGDGGLE